ncbi:MAG: hypothetical protein WC785_08875 [Tatlockia sp.]
MRTWLKLFFLVFLTLSTSQNALAEGWFSKEANGVKLQAFLFLSSTCPHCQKEEAFFNALQPKKPWLTVNRFQVNENKAALQLFNQQLQALHQTDFTVPAVFFCHSRWAGFASSQTTGRALEEGLDYCHQQILKEGALQHATVNVLNQLANASWLATTMPANASPVSMLTSIALMDAFSPCSLFIILALFSFLWLFRDPGIKVAFGLVFILALGVVHHLQQSHLFFLNDIRPLIRLVSIAVGMAVIAYLVRIYFRSTTDKPNVGVPLLIGFTAAILEVFQQSGIPNFALVFQQWLSAGQHSVPRLFFFNLLYQVIYLAPLSILVYFFLKLHRRARTDDIQNLVICFSWCYLFLLGLLFMFYPEGLRSMKLSFMVFVVAFAAGLLATKQKKRLGIVW